MLKAIVYTQTELEEAVAAAVAAERERCAGYHDDACARMETDKATCEIAYGQACDQSIAQHRRYAAAIRALSSK